MILHLDDKIEIEGTPEEIFDFMQILQLANILARPSVVTDEDRKEGEGEEQEED